MTSCHAAAMLLVILPPVREASGVHCNAPSLLSSSAFATSWLCMQSTPSLEVLVNAAGTWTSHEVQCLMPKCDDLFSDISKARRCPRTYSTWQLTECTIDHRPWPMHVCAMQLQGPLDGACTPLCIAFA